jgi:hypothetical protein
MEKQKEFQIDNLMNAFKKMPYFRNFAASSGAVHNISKHEDAVKDILIQHGLAEFSKPKTATKNVIKSWINNPSLAKMPDMSFIVQPCGTHDNPDFIIKIKENVVFGIECKSSDKKTKCPMYNSGGITQNYIYVYSSEATNETTIYLGKDILSMEQQKLIDEHILAVRKMDEELNKKLKAIDVNNRGVCYYTRPMICQAGGALLTDYFTHEKRKECEENVIQFVKEMNSP